jgi:hypothetical protein
MELKKMNIDYDLFCVSCGRLIYDNEAIETGLCHACREREQIEDADRFYEMACEDE